MFHKFLDPVGIGPQESRFEVKTSGVEDEQCDPAENRVNEAENGDT